jgi:hypothetical protein
MPIKDVYPPSAFRIVRGSALSKADFDAHPIWSEYYDFEERDEIEEWGVDREWLDTALDGVYADGNDHPCYTILRPYPLPARMRQFLKATFTTPAGRSLNGYVMNEDAYVVSVFVGADEEFGFSRHPHLSDSNALDLGGLCAAIGTDDPIFPLRYRTEFLDSEDRLIEGTFSPG